MGFGTPAVPLLIKHLYKDESTTDPGAAVPRGRPLGRRARKPGAKGRPVRSARGGNRDSVPRRSGGRRRRGGSSRRVGVGSQDLLGEVVDDAGFVAQRGEVGGAEQLLLAVAQRFPNRLLHLRIGELALSRRNLRDQLD